MSECRKLSKKDLIINGSSRRVLVSGDEKLVDVLRGNFGLLGTKVGCRKNQCGICSVILNGELVRSCVISMNQVEDFSVIITIEGIGTPDNLHPIQLAFMRLGASQCGFCTPGFIVSSKALLDKNPQPTRTEVRAWFKQNRNICRCTGYKPIVDAVMEAAKALRGDISVDELRFQLPANGRIFGTDKPRPSAIAKVTGTYDYGADTGLMMSEGVLKLALVQAKVSHANIIDINTDIATKMPGVEAVLTYKDVQGTNRIDGLVFYPWNKGDGLDRPILCDEKIFQYGDAIAIVCADTVEHARAAADAVIVEIEELPPYMSAREAAADDAAEIHPGTPNVFFDQALIKGQEPEQIYPGCDLVIEREYSSQRQPHLVLEPDVGYAYYDEEGKLTIHSKSIGLYMHRSMIAGGLGLSEDQIRLVQNNAGGTFGYKLSPTIEAILGVACMATGKPVYLEFDMHQQLTYTGKRSPFFMKVKAGVKDGKIQAMSGDFLGDHGAYSEFGDLLLTKPLQFFGAGYHVENMHSYGRICFTNHAYGAAMRAFGSPQGFFAGESLIDEIAAELKIDPFEFRYQNLYNDQSTAPTGNKPDVVVFKQLFDLLRPAYQKARKDQAACPEKDGIKRGVGVSIGIYCCGDDSADTSTAAVELMPDGKITMYSTWEDHGQGSDMGVLTLTHEALHELGLSPDDIIMVANDTSRCVNSGNAGGSRSQIMVGNAIYEACNQLKQAMRKEDGSYRNYDDMQAEGLDTYYEGIYSTANLCTQIDPATLQFNPYVAYMYAAYIAEVDVDTKTGDTTVVGMTGAYDVGKIGNITVVKGQAYGGFSQAIGMALYEEFEDMRLQSDLLKSGFPTIDLIPDKLDLMFLETPRPNSSFGCSGVGEIVTAGPHCSIINAIFDACGARVRQLPAYPERVLAALPKKYNHTTNN